MDGKTGGVKTISKKEKETRFQIQLLFSGNTVYKWEGSDYRWSREKLAHLKNRKFFQCY
jgi:hypothetical protein